MVWLVGLLGAGGGAVGVFEMAVDCFRGAVRRAGVIEECEDVLRVVLDGPVEADQFG